MILKNITEQGIADYLENQLNFFFPDKIPVRSLIASSMQDALARVKQCINGVRIWAPNNFDYLHSTQYSIFLYFLSNTIWHCYGNENGVCTKLFLLNKALNGIDCFYEIELPMASILYSIRIPRLGKIMVSHQLLVMASLCILIRPLSDIAILVQEVSLPKGLALLIKIPKETAWFLMARMVALRQNL